MRTLEKWIPGLRISTEGAPPPPLKELLREARIGHNFTIKELAKRAKVAPSTISQAEGGATIPRPRALRSLVGVLKLDPASTGKARTEALRQKAMRQQP